MRAKVRYLVFIVCFLPILLHSQQKCSLKDSSYKYDLSAKYSKKVIKAMGDNQFYPFSFINKDGKPDGFDTELFDLLMKKLGLKYQLTLGDFADARKQLQIGKIDVIPGMFYSPQRAKYLCFGIPHNVMSYQIISRKEDNVTTISNLRGKKIVAQDGDRIYDFFMDKINKGEIDVKDFVASKTIIEGLRGIESGKYDLMVLYDVTTDYYIKEYHLKDLAVNRSSLVPDRYSIAVNKENEDLIYLLNMALYEAKADGSYDRIYNKWFGVYDKSRIPMAFWIVLLSIVFLLFVATIFTVFLRFKVRKATKDITKSNKNLHLALEAGNLNVWQYDIKNNKFNSIDGVLYKAIDNTFDGAVATINEQDRAIFIKGFDDLISGKKQKTNIVFRSSNTLNKMGEIYVKSYMVIDKKHNIIIGTANNITQRYLHQSAMADFRYKLDFIINASNLSIWNYDVETQKVIYMYDNLSEFYSVLPQDHIVDADFVLAYVREEDKPKVAEMFDKMSKGIDEKIQIEYLFRYDKYKHYISKVSIVAPFQKDANKKVTKYMALTRDNTQWNNLFSEMSRLKTEAEQSNKLKSTFLANMSHEIRTPLNAIVGFSDLLLSADDEDRNLYNNIIKTNSNLLLKLINDLLDISRMEAGLLEFKRDWFDLHSNFEDLYTMFANQMKDGVELKYDDATPHIIVYFDKDRINQVMINFINNAIKFTQTGYIKFGYELIQKEDKDYLRLYVSDSGIGISKENQEKVFVRFEKLNSFMQGTGLGLSICKILSDIINGDIGCDSAEGEGSTFWICIPIEYNKNCLKPEG